MSTVALEPVILFNESVTYVSTSAARTWCVGTPVKVTSTLPEDPKAYINLGYNQPYSLGECHHPLTQNEHSESYSLHWAADFKKSIA